MARKPAKKNDDENLKDDLIQNEDVEPEITEIADGEGAEDDISYTMGDIKTLENEGEDEKLELKKATDDEDEDVEWIDPAEGVIQEDYDPYLDNESYDMDNPYGDDDSY